MNKTNYNRVLGAVDLTSVDERLLDRLAGIRESQGADVFLLSVLDPLPADFAASGIAGAVPVAMTNEAERLQRAGTKLDELSGKVGPEAIITHVEIGVVVDVILAHAKNYEADLIVLGSHGRSGLSRVLGSTASAIVHLAKCDVLTVRLHD